MDWENCYLDKRNRVIDVYIKTVDFVNDNSDLLSLDLIAWDYSIVRILDFDRLEFEKELPPVPQMLAGICNLRIAISKVAYDGNFAETLGVLFSLYQNSLDALDATIIYEPEYSYDPNDCTLVEGIYFTITTLADTHHKHFNMTSDDVKKALNCSAEQDDPRISESFSI